MQKLIAALPRLSPDELQELAGRAKALAAVTPTTSSKPTVEVATAEDMLLDAISTTMSRMGVEHTSMSMLRKGPHYASFKEKAPSVIQFVRKAVPGDRLKQMAVLSIGVKLLYKNLEEMELPVSSRYLMQHIHRLPSVINKSFPGYATAGMLAWILRGERKK